MSRRNPGHVGVPLADLAAEGMDVEAWCNEVGCGHHARLPIGPLLERFGADFPIPELARFLRCGRCGSSRYVEARGDARQRQVSGSPKSYPG